MTFAETKEWGYCLAVPNRSRRTWLRITQEREDELYSKLKRVVIIISIAAILAGFFAAYRFGEYMQTKRIYQNATPVQIQQTIPVQLQSA